MFGIKENMSIENKLAELSLYIGEEIKIAVRTTPYKTLCGTGKSRFKGEGAKNADIIGEEATITLLESFLHFMPKIKYDSKNYSYKIGLILNPGAGDILFIGDKESAITIWAYSDAVDGTIKVAGLGNEKLADDKQGNQGMIYRLGNDGVWGAGMALSKPTEKSFQDLTIGDFEISAIVDGNPAEKPTAPRNAYTWSNSGGISTRERAYEINTGIPTNPELDPFLRTSTQTKISQGVINFSDFQAYDLKTVKPGTIEFGHELRKILSDRNKDGAFDIWNMYGTFGSIMRNMLGYGVEKYEPQGICNIWLNDHLANTIPPYAIVKGAGGFVINENGTDIGTLKLTEGMPNVFYIANQKVLDHIVKCCDMAKQNMKTTY